MCIKVNCWIYFSFSCLLDSNQTINLFFMPPQKFSLLHLASTKKVLANAPNNENSLDDTFEYVPPKVSYRRYSVCLLGKTNASCSAFC